MCYYYKKNAQTNNGDFKLCSYYIKEEKCVETKNILKKTSYACLFPRSSSYLVN